MESQLRLDSYSDLEKFEIREDKPKNKSDICKFTGKKCVMDYLHVMADVVNPEGCNKVCCRMCDNLSCRVKCRGVGQHICRVPEEYRENGWHEIGFGKHPFPENRGKAYEVFVLYELPIRSGKGYFALSAGYENYKFTILDKRDNLSKGEIVGWKYVEDNRYSRTSLEK